MLRTVLLVDETVILEGLVSVLRKDERIEIVGAYSNPLELLEALPSLEADFLFLDIEMPELSGMALADRLQAKSSSLEIVFVTAYNHYAAQAFEVNAVDYLLKPIRPERMKKTIDKLVQAVQNALLQGRRLFVTAFAVSVHLR